MVTAIAARGRPAETALVFGASAALFALSATAFEARVTDLSALRLLDGDVPYRDFWTMYAPGSFLALAGAFALLGRELLVSNLLGVLTSAAAVAAYYRLARAVADPRAAVLAAGLVALAFFATGYQNGFTSYPPAFLMILAAVCLSARGCREPGWTWAVAPGLLLGASAVFKHDVAGYAALAIAPAVVLARRRAGIAPVWTPLLALGIAAMPLPAATVGALVLAGAGPDMWNDLVRFPLTDFRHVRPEYFPLLPRLRSTPIAMALELTWWGTCNLPLVALIAGVLGLWRRRRDLDAVTSFVSTFAFVGFWLHWSAAHVQLNTHAITLTAWSLLLAGAALRRSETGARPRWAPLALAALLAWGGIFLARPVYRLAAGERSTEWVGLPGLRGIDAPTGQAVWMRGLAAALAEAGPPDARLLFVAHRNDLNVFAESTPYWLTTRRPATRHHELHPGVTDTEPVQRQMLGDVSREPWPVVVREYRFSDASLDATKREMIRHVPIGSRLLDQWVGQHYEPAARFGPYELMRETEPPTERRRDASARR